MLLLLYSVRDMVKACLPFTWLPCHGGHSDHARLPSHPLLLDNNLNLFELVWLIDVTASQRRSSQTQTPDLFFSNTMLL